MPEKIGSVSNPEIQTSLHGNAATSSESDRRFEEQLKNEEEKLKARVLPFSAWNQWEKLFTAFSFHADQSLTLAKIENDFNPQREPPPPHPQIDSSSPVSSNQEKGSSSAASFEKNYRLDPQMFQEMLSHSLGATAAVPAFSFLPENPFFITRSQLQTIIDEIVEQISLLKNAKKTELLLGLKPESLGSILLKVASRDGTLTIQILTNEGTKKLLEGEIEGLKTALKNADLNIGSLSVSIGNSSAFSGSPNLFGDIPLDFSQTLVEKEPQTMLNLGGKAAQTKRVNLSRHLIDWEA